MNWALALPEIVLALCGMAILLLGVLRRGDTTALCGWAVLAAFVLAAVLVATGADGHAYHDMFIVDAFARFAKLLILTGAALACLLAMDWNRREGIARFEFPVLALFATVGMMLMVSASSFMSLYLGLELQSLSLYVMAAFARDDVRSSEAGLKYFVLGALASGLLLYGISLVYGFSGGLDFAGVAQAVASPELASPGFIVGVMFVVVGLAFKISAVPFHMWAPDVYQGAPTPVTAFFGTAPKVAAMALLLRVLGVPFVHVPWIPVVMLMSIGSMLLGSFGAIAQTNIKRLMAYSSIGHVGYALIGLAAGTVDGVRGVLIYLVTYVFMNIGSFAVIAAMRRRGRAVENIVDLAGLGRTDPGLALALAVFMFSMAGIPPLAGFFGKLYVFLAAVQRGQWTLAVIGVLTSVIGAVYYLRVIKVMYFDAPGEPFEARATATSVLVFGCALFTALFFLFPSAIVASADAAARSLF